MCWLARRGSRSLGLGLGLGLFVMLGVPSLAHAQPSGLQLAQPVDRARVRGEPAVVPVQLEPGQAATELRVEVDGAAAQTLPSADEGIELRLEPGLHRVEVVGRHPSTGAVLRSGVVQVAVFPEAAKRRPPPVQRHGMTAAVAFVIAVGGATALRRRGRQ